MKLKFHWVGNHIICANCHYALMATNTPFLGYITLWHPVPASEICKDLAGKSFTYKAPVLEAEEISGGVVIEEPIHYPEPT